MPLGKHLILECYGCDVTLLKDAASLEDVFKQAALYANATVLHSYFHKFDRGEGVTGVVALSESHISVHTWPEHEYMAIDIFMCGECDPSISARYILRYVPIKYHMMQIMDRGNPCTLQS